MATFARYMIQRMRFLFAFLVAAALLPAHSATAQAPPATPWLTSLDEALAQARATNRPILIEFSGTDWCAPCIRLRREVFDTPEFLAWAATHLILLREDFPRRPENLLSPEQTKANAAVAARYNPQGDFPVEVLLDADGKVLANSEGYRPGGPLPYIEHLRELLPALGR